NGESIILKYQNYTIQMFRSAKILDGCDKSDMSFDVVLQVKGIKQEMFKEIKNLVLKSKDDFPSNLKERCEFISKKLDEIYGQFWCVLIGGHYNKLSSYWLEQYIEFYHQGLLYCIYRSF